MHDTLSGAADKDIQIDAPVRFLHMIEEEACITAFAMRRRLLPKLEAPLQFLGRDIQLQRTQGHIKLDHVAILHQRQCPANGRFGRDVEHNRTIGGAAHAPI